MIFRLLIAKTVYRKVNILTGNTRVIKITVIFDHLGMNLKPCTVKSRNIAHLIFNAHPELAPSRRHQYQQYGNLDILKKCLK